MSGSVVAAMVPLVVVAVAFIGYCLRDLAAQQTTRYFAKWLWAVLCVVSVPLGGVIYLVLGREASHPLSDADL